MESERGPTAPESPASIASAKQQPMGMPHWVWDPLAHRTFGESCYFYLLRLRRQTSTSMGPFLSTILDRAQILGGSGYSLLGQFDALLRVWATPQKRDRLVNTFTQFVPNIVEVVEFEAATIEYLWREAEPTLEFLTKLSVQDKNAVEQVSFAFQDCREPPSNLLQGLRDQGVLFTTKPVAGDNHIKVFMHLRPDDNEKPSRAEIGQIKRALVAFDTGNNPSLYQSRNSSELILKVVIPVGQLGQLLQAVESAVDALRTDTYPILLPPLFESDLIDVKWVDMNPSLLALDERLRGLAVPHLKRMTQEERNDVIRVFDGAQDVLDSSLSHTLEGYLLARLERNYRILAEKLIFIFEVEHLTALWLRIRLTQRPNSQRWVAEIKDLLAARKRPDSNVAAEHFPDKVSLKDLSIILGVLSEAGYLDPHEVDAIFGSGWSLVFERVRYIRNALAHGRIKPEAASYFDEDWGQSAMDAVRMMRACLELQKLTEEAEVL